jgi:hypothetical protein
VTNFSESYADLDAQGLSVLALSAEQLAATVAEVWASASANSTSEQALTERCASHIQKLLAMLAPVAPPAAP